MTAIHIPTEENKEIVKQHSVVGTPQSVIAEILDIDDKTLRRHYRKELDFSTSQSNAAVGGSLYKKAMSGDTAAMIFWMKTRAGWREIREDAQPAEIKINIVNPNDKAIDKTIDD